MKNILTLITFLAVGIFYQTQAQDQKIVFITLDGWRWQELFYGLDEVLTHNPKYNTKGEGLIYNFDAKTIEEKRERIMPFIWNYVAENGVILGDRKNGSFVNVSNSLHFSYPGYSETITGFADNDRVNSNKKVLNPNVSIFEKLNQHPWYKNSVYIFGSWDVFPFIFNYERSQLPINAGYMQIENPTEIEKIINKMQVETPKRWGTVRYDVFTHNYALETLKTKKPKILYVGYGETDDFAHEGDYDHYIESANVNDQMIKELWEYTQQDPFYKDQTTFIITTDHGRGEGDAWHDHGNDVRGASDTWIMMFGNKVKKINPKGQFYNNQLAATMAKILDFDYKSEKPIGKPLF